MSKLVIRTGDYTFDARFEEQLAPKTVAAFRKALPFESHIIHVRWSGEGVWMPLGDLDFGVGYENHTSYPAPGQIILYPGGISETEILLAYGGVHFASKMGQLAGNHFITLTSGLENLATLGKCVLWKGALRIRFQQVCGTGTRYPRDLRGYGRNPPHPQWPGNARVAVQFVVNFEEGSENNILHGDPASEAFLSDVLGAQPWPGQRHANIESMFEYGSRAGFWRLWRLFSERKWPTTVFGVATALKRNPEIVAAMKEAGWDIASHSLKWIEHKDMTEAQERAEIAEAIRVHTAATGSRPLGWYTGRSSINTNRLLMEEGGFLYLCDSYADDLPYWVKGASGKQLVIPYTLDANDMRFINPQGFAEGEQFFTYLKDAFDVLYAEGESAPKMMSVGLHCRLAGRPGRAAGLIRFLDYIGKHDRVWVPTRLQIAQHWHDKLAHLAADAFEIG